MRTLKKKAGYKEKGNHFGRILKIKQFGVLLSASLLALQLTGCSGGNFSADSPIFVSDSSSDTGNEHLKIWSLQLTGEVNPNKPVELFDTDLFETSAETINQMHDKNITVICYFSAGTWEPYRPDSDQYPSEAIGNTLENWPDEKWIDIRNQQVRDILAQRIALAKQKGCDGVDPDNVDGYTNNPGFDFTAEDQLDFNRFLATTAHQYGLMVGLKNDVAQLDNLVDYFDFAINEECHGYNECDAYQTTFIQKNKPVLNIEYDDVYRNNPEARRQFCQQTRSEGISTLIANQNLDGSEVYSCALDAPL